MRISVTFTALTPEQIDACDLSRPRRLRDYFTIAGMVKDMLAHREATTPAPFVSAFDVSAD